MKNSILFLIILLIMLLIMLCIIFPPLIFFLFIGYLLICLVEFSQYNFKTKKYRDKYGWHLNLFHPKYNIFNLIDYYIFGNIFKAIDKFADWIDSLPQIIKDKDE